VLEVEQALHQLGQVIRALARDRRLDLEQPAQLLGRVPGRELVGRHALPVAARRLSLQQIADDDAHHLRPQALQGDGRFHRARTLSVDAIDHVAARERVEPDGELGAAAVDQLPVAIDRVVPQQVEVQHQDLRRETDGGSLELGGVGAGPDNFDTIERGRVLTGLLAQSFVEDCDTDRHLLPVR
jgi:hypothetical protein